MLLLLVTPLSYTRSPTGVFTCIKYSEPLSISHYSGWRVTTVQSGRPSASGHRSSYLGYSVPLQGFLPEGKDRTSGSNFLFICLTRRERAREKRGGKTKMISDHTTSLTSDSDLLLNGLLLKSQQKHAQVRHASKNLREYKRLGGWGINPPPATAPFSASWLFHLRKCVFFLIQHRSVP